MRHLIIVVIMLAILLASSLLLAACGSGQILPMPATATLAVTPPPTVTLTPKPSQTPTATFTSELSQTPTATLFPFPTLVIAEISNRTGRLPLAAGNLDQVTVLNMLIHPTGVDNILFTADTTLVATTQSRGFLEDIMTDEDKAIRVWDLQSGETTLLREAQWPRTAIFTQDGTKLVFDEGGSKLVIRDIASGREQTFEVDGEIQSLSLTPDGKSVMVGHWGAIALLNILTGQWEIIFENAGKSFPDVAMSPDGKMAYFIQSGDFNSDGFVRFLNLETSDVSDLKIDWSFPTVSPEHIAISQDGGLLAVASLLEVMIWDTRTNQAWWALKDGCQTIAFSPDGKLLASTLGAWSGGSGKAIGIWDTENWKLLKTFQGNPDYLTKVAFSPDGTYLASADGGGTVVLWGISAHPLSMPSVVIVGAEDSLGLANLVPAVWLATSDKPARYQIQFTGSCTVVGSCSYTGGHTLVIRSCSAMATIEDLQTNTTIAAETFTGGIPFNNICPDQRAFSDLTDYADGNPASHTFSQWLLSIMQKQEP